MENQIRKELSELCQSILADADENKLSENLTRSQILYEKLLILNYLKQNPTPKAAVEETKPLTQAIPVDTVAPKSTAPINQPQVVAEEEAQVDEIVSNDTLPLKQEEDKSHGISINASLADKTLKIGLNDRIAFVKHLFMGQQEDFNRVLSQLNTFSTYEEAESFLNQMIRPDYGWDEKEEFVDRLIKIVQLRFGIEQ
jgi:hypothetical protein